MPSASYVRTALLSVLVAVSTASPLKSFAKRQADYVPVVNADFPDPGLFQASDGSWHAFATAGNGVNTQYAKSADFKTWELQEGVDALASAPAWAADPPNVWAPEVVQLGNSSFLMYFAASSADDPSHHCVGSATATSVGGPYTPADEPFVCDTDAGGQIDPAIYQDRGGRMYVIYKVDANSIGNGGVCGNTVEPIVPTPIMIQEVDRTDGVTKVGDPVEILNRNASDGPLVEAPSIAKMDGTYFLFFSSNCYSTPEYDTAYATASSVTGPYTKANEPLFVTGDFGLTAPGGASIAPDGRHMVFHADLDGGRGRAMYATTIEAQGLTVSTV